MSSSRVSSSHGPSEMPDGVDGQTDGHRHTNGHYQTEPDQKVLRSPFRALIQDFSPIWFTWCMNAGIIAILLHQLPYKFDGVRILSTIAFLIDFVLFIVFSVLFLLRFVFFGQQAYYEITGSTSELALGACVPIAWQTIAALVCLIVSEASWGAHSFTIVGYTMWWIGTAWMLAYLLFAILTIIRRHSTHYRQLSPMIVIPAVGVATVATTGGLISIYSDRISGRMAVPVIIVSYLVAGIGLFMSIFLYTMLLLQLFLTHWPAPADTAAMFVFVGPMGQTAAALQLLGSAAHTYHRFQQYQKPHASFLTPSSAASLEAASILLALLMTGMGSAFALIAIVAMCERAYTRKLKWSPAWNSIIFPTGTLTTSFLEFSIELDSPAFRTVTTAIVILLVFFFFVNLGFTLWEIFKGRLLIVREDPREKSQGKNDVEKQA